MTDINSGDPVEELRLDGGSPELSVPEYSPQEEGEISDNGNAGENHTNEDIDQQVLLQNGDDDDENALIRLGTTSSARFNILSTMVGGGSLSLPFAFAKSGNVLIAPILLFIISCLSEFCFRILVQAARVLSYRNTNLSTTTKVGNDSFESLAEAAFGQKAYIASMALVTSMCFFGTVGYAVLLRDMLEPITVQIYGIPQPAGPSWHNNSTLWIIVILVTPLCTLQTLTSLKRFGAASMFSVLILGLCIVYRSLQCNFVDKPSNPDWHHWTDSFQLFPQSWWDVLDAFPLYISCYVCHYNILTVHNEFRQPTVPRVRWWLRSTNLFASLFYLTMGVAGSAYGAKCTPDGHVDGNILLDFDNADPLLLVGRMCLAITITLAFPMLTIPARDIVLRSIQSYQQQQQEQRAANESNPQDRDSDTMPPESSLEEPLLSSDEEQATGSGVESSADRTLSDSGAPTFTYFQRLWVAMVLFWTATVVASCVSSIDVVWDLLGSSLSILLSVLIPCASFLVLTQEQPPQSSQVSTPEEEVPRRPGMSWKHLTSRSLSWILIGVFIPLMFLSTGNAVYHTFF